MRTADFGKKHKAKSERDELIIMGDEDYKLYPLCLQSLISQLLSSYAN
jgi:hypothetical protein